MARRAGTAHRRTPDGRLEALTSLARMRGAPFADELVSHSISMSGMPERAARILMEWDTPDACNALVRLLLHTPLSALWLALSLKNCRHAPAAFL